MSWIFLNHRLLNRKSDCTQDMNDPYLSVRSGNSSPGGRHLRILRIPVPQKHLKLMGGQGCQSRPLRPPAEFALAQTLVTQPKPLSVIGEHTDGRALPVGENEQAPAQRILLESVAAKGTEPIDTGAEIGGIDGHKDAHLRSDLDPVRLQKVLARSIKLRSSAPLMLMRIRLRSGCSNSMTHSQGGEVADKFTSTNPLARST